MSDWKLRPATPDDLEPLVEIRAVVMRPDLERLGRYDAERVRQRLRDAFVPANTQVIEVSSALAGCVALRRAEDGLWLAHFLLAPDCQGTGIGSAVLREVLSHCDAEGATVRLNVLQGSPALRLYERHGFTLESQDPIDVYLLREPRHRVG